MTQPTDPTLQRPATPPTGSQNGSLRIRRHNEHNWTLEEFIPAHVSEVGRHRGKESPDRWVIRGYYLHLKGAARAAIDARLEGTEVFQGELEQVLSAIQAAEDRACDMVTEALAGIPYAS